MPITTRDGDDTQADAAFVPDACEGLRCFQVDCEAKNLPPTTISGTVYAPNGTLPLFGVNVYVPETDPGPLVDGATCARCDDGLQGGAIAQAITDETGHFTLANVPATMNVPVVIQVGKWRRQLNIPNVAACQDLPIDVADTTLPKSMTDMTPNTTSVDMPRIAISTGNADALECLVAQARHRRQRDHDGAAKVVASTCSRILGRGGADGAASPRSRGLRPVAAARSPIRRACGTRRRRRPAASTR